MLGTFHCSIFVNLSIEKRSSRLPHMAKKLEEHLYRSAPTRDEYLDSSSLKRRLHLIAKGVGVPKPNSEDDNASPLLDRMGAPMDLQNVMLQQNSIQMNASAPPQHMQQSNLLPPNNMQHAMQPLPTGSQGNAVLNPQQMQITPQILQQLQMQQLIQNQPTNNAPQSAEISNAHSTNKDTPGSSRVDDAHAKKKVQVLQQQQRRLMLLRHSKLCNNPKCTTKFCPQMIVLWKHLKFCRGTTCPVPHCVSSRCVLSHHFNCKQKNISNTCEICFPVKQLAEKLGDTEDDWNDDWDVSVCLHNNHFYAS
jgi:E1A/CREB-binding protein